MKLILSIATAALFAYSVIAQTPSRRGVLMSAGEDAYHAKLQLTTAIVDEHYCKNRIRYSVSFKFTNVGEKSIVLDRFRPIVSRYLISANDKAAAKREYEADARVLTGLDTATSNATSDLDQSNFIILETGKSYEVNEKFSISIENEGGKPLRPGPHMLQLVVSTWYHPYASNIEWRERLRDKGYLWSDSVISDPMPFMIPKRLTASDCP